MKKVKKFLFKPQVRSRHPSHSPLRKGLLEKQLAKSVIRFGSFTEFPDTIVKGGSRVEINTVNAIKNSANKKAMKRCFSNNNVITAPWFIADKTKFVNSVGDKCNIEDLPFPLVSKHIHGSRGKGNVKHDTLDAFKNWMKHKNLDNYVFEQFLNYAREYRLHVTEDGCFYTCRKMLKEGTPDNKKWFRNDQNCVWYLEDNPKFDKPSNWDTIVKESVKALKSVGLDFGAVDVKVQSSTNKKGEVRKEPAFFIIEINSAPSFGEITQKRYVEMLNNLLKKKIND